MRAVVEHPDSGTRMVDPVLSSTTYLWDDFGKLLGFAWRPWENGDSDGTYPSGFS